VLGCVLKSTIATNGLDNRIVEARRRELNQQRAKLPNPGRAAG
jgi:hypothetical protein